MSPAPSRRSRRAFPGHRGRLNRKSWTMMWRGIPVLPSRCGPSSRCIATTSSIWTTSTRPARLDSSARNWRRKGRAESTACRRASSASQGRPASAWASPKGREQASPPSGSSIRAVTASIPYRRRAATSPSGRRPSKPCPLVAEGTSVPGSQERSDRTSPLGTGEKNGFIVSISSRVCASCRVSRTGP